MLVKSTFLLSRASYLPFRLFTTRIFVEGLPADWSHHEVAQRFSIAGTVQKVNLVRNSLGQATGKAIVTYEQESAATAAQEKFDN